MKYLTGIECAYSIGQILSFETSKKSVILLELYLLNIVVMQFLTWGFASVLKTFFLMRFAIWRSN